MATRRRSRSTGRRTKRKTTSRRRSQTKYTPQAIVRAYKAGVLTETSRKGQIPKLVRSIKRARALAKIYAGSQIDNLRGGKKRTRSGRKRTRSKSRSGKRSKSRSRSRSKSRSRSRGGRR